MKYWFAILSFYSTILPAQVNVSYGYENDSSIYLYFTQDRIRLEKSIDSHPMYYDLVEKHNIIDCHYWLAGDTIIIENPNKRIHLIKQDDDILLLINDLNSEIKSGRFYRKIERYPDGNLKVIGSWKNGLKDGYWLYVDEKGARVRVTYHEGKVLEKITLELADTICIE